MVWPLADRVTPLRWRNGATSAGSRAIPEEVPLALTYNGSAYAVMMVTPADLADFALGFSISENVVDSASEIEKSRHHRRRRRHRSPLVAQARGGGAKHEPPKEHTRPDGLRLVRRRKHCARAEGRSPGRKSRRQRFRRGTRGGDGRA